MSACVYLEVFMSTKNEEGVWIRSDGKPDPRKGALTGRQKTFARLIVEGLYSNAECARKAGYAVDTAAVYASKLLNGREYPHVLEYIDELREERERQYGVTTIGQLERLQQGKGPLDR
jgi:phage terminase small subunit